MRLYCERPGNRDANGNLFREINQFSSAEQIPALEEGSMFLFLLSREEAKNHQGLLQQKLGAFSIEGRNLLWYAIEGREPAGWSIQSTLFPHLQGRGLHPISVYRRRKGHPEQILVIFDLLPDIKSWFEQGATVSTIYEHFQGLLLEYAEEIYKKHNRIRPTTVDEARNLREQVAELKKALDDLNDQGFFLREDHLRSRQRIISLIERLLRELSEKIQTLSNPPKKQTFREWYTENRWEFWMGSVLAALIVGIITALVVRWL